MVNFKDVLYTPLDVEDLPQVETQKLLCWIENNYESLSEYRLFLSSNGLVGNKEDKNNVWDLTVAYWNAFGSGPGWLGNFNTEFPALANHLLSVFGVHPKEIGTVILLPLRASQEGLGVWHRDPDIAGLRVYLDINDVDEDKLLLKKTKVPYEPTDAIPGEIPISEETHEKFFQSTVYECKRISKNQHFFINNFRSIHTTYTSINSIGKPRIACLISSRFDNQLQFAEKVSELITTSAKKFDESIFWENDG